MRFSRSSSLFSLLIYVACFAGTSLCQTLTIKKTDTNYLIEAVAPASGAHTVQASRSMGLWVDIGDIVGSGSFPFTNFGVSQRYFRLIPKPAEAEPIRIVIIGDSMASDCCGWGIGSYGYFKPNVAVVNYAMPWVSTTIFLQSAEVEKMQLLEPNYVLVQYGYMDGGDDPDRNTTLEEFDANLRTIVQMIRDFNGVPILITLHAPRLWTPQGKVIEPSQVRNDVIRNLAAELNLPLIDLYKLTLEDFNKLGPAGTAFMQNNTWPGDYMHVSTAGARHFSRMIANELPNALGPYLTGILDAPAQP